MVQATNRRLLPPIPEALEDRLWQEYNNLSRHYILGDYRSAGLDAGRFCEVVYVILDGYTNGGRYGKVENLGGMVDACRNILEQRPKTFERSMRLTIPRLLPVLYEIRNSRDVGHVSSEINSNYMDAVFVMNSVSWVAAELIRVCNYSIGAGEAQRLVDGMMRTRTVPLVWEVDGRKIVMSNDLSSLEEALVILYCSTGSTREMQELLDDINPSDRSHFKTRVIMRGYKEKLWLFHPDTNIVKLSPLGIKRAEEVITRVRETSCS